MSVFFSFQTLPRPTIKDKGLITSAMRFNILYGMELFNWFLIYNCCFCIINFIHVTARVDHPKYNSLFGTGRYTEDEIVSTHSIIKN